MTHDELLAKTKQAGWTDNKVSDRITVVVSDWNAGDNTIAGMKALRAVVELHKPELIESGEDSIFVCSTCNPEWFWDYPYPCPTIQAIEKELA